MKLPEYKFLVPVALLLGLAPFYPQPHIVEKTLMLASGTLRRPIDIFDLIWHGWPFALIAVRLFRDLKRKRSTVPGAAP